MTSIQSIKNFEILDARLSYVLCSGDNRLVCYSYRNGEWFRKIEGNTDIWNPSLPPPLCSRADQKGLAGHFQKWQRTKDCSILFSMCCKCGDHALGLALSQAGANVSHGYCDKCFAELEKEIAADNEKLHA